MTEPREYAQALYELSDECHTTEAVMSDLFVPYKGVSDTHFEINTRGKYIEQLVPTMYGGRYVDTCAKYLKMRTAGKIGRAHV